jgi:hypothetical protein
MEFVLYGCDLVSLIIVERHVNVTDMFRVGIYNYEEM